MGLRCPPTRLFRRGFYEPLACMKGPQGGHGHEFIEGETRLIELGGVGKGMCPSGDRRHGPSLRSNMIPAPDELVCVWGTRGTRGAHIQIENWTLPPSALYITYIYLHIHT